MNQAVLMHPDIHKSPEGGDIGDDSRKFHAYAKIFHFFDAAGKAHFKRLSGVPPGLGQLIQDVFKGRQSHGSGNITGNIDPAAKLGGFIRSVTVQPRSFAMASTIG